MFSKIPCSVTKNPAGIVRKIDIQGQSQQINACLKKSSHDLHCHIGIYSSTTVEGFLQPVILNEGQGHSN